jgi:hypothetical protein
MRGEAVHPQDPIAHGRRWREALEAIIAIDEQPGDPGGRTPDYWAGIGECADIARVALFPLSGGDAA